MNQKGFSVRLRDAAECIANGSESWTLSAAVSSTLTGSVTITGIVDSNGAAVPWVLNAGTVAGVYAAPGSGRNGGRSAYYQLANAAADVGKVTIIALPIT